MSTAHNDQTMLKAQNGSWSKVLSVPPQITILLATYNGERYLAEQINSIIQQTYSRVKIIASDDGSTDRTLEILKHYSIEVHQGPRQGFAANFLSLLEKVDGSCNYYAFADQDDIWALDKLQRAFDYLTAIKSDEPALYCARTSLVNEHVTFIGYSPLFKKPPGFLNALVQNIGGGNTMVFNRAAFNLLRQTKSKHCIISHDWWAYLLITGAGGVVFYDPIPSLHYRQHRDNLIGNNIAWYARFHRILWLFQGRLKSWIDQNNRSLLEVAHLLTTKHRHQLEAFESIRHRWFIPRLIYMIQLGIYRQTVFGQLGLLVGTLFNKI